MNLPKQQTLDQLQAKWPAILNPVIANLLVQGRLIENVSLTSGANVINHGLGRNLIGWFLVRINAAATIYDTQDTNQMPTLTLNLTSNATAIVALWVF